MSFNVSQSKIKTWRQCRKAYEYKYIMELTKKHKPMPFLRGGIIHDMLEAHYLNKDPWVVFDKQIKENEKLLRNHQDDYGDLEGLIKTLMMGYFKHYKKEKIKVLKVEEEFRTKIAPGIYLTGKIDMVAKMEKLNWLVEHKCHNTIPTDSSVPITNLQSSLYVHALEKEYDLKVDGVMWNYLHGKPLSTPELLKNGTMSRKAINTTWPMYREALFKAGLEPSDYFDIKEKLKGKEDLIYQRKPVPIDKAMVKNILADTKVTAIECEKLGGKDTTRNLGRHCDYCEFKNLCLAQLKGLDSNFILKSDFKRREKN